MRKSVHTQEKIKKYLTYTFIHQIIIVARGGKSMLDKLKILENIKILSKVRKIPLSDIEKKSGVSIGYCARLISDIKDARENGNEEKPIKERPLPSTDVIAKTAEILGVSVDSLLNYDFENLTDPESMLIIFVDNLTKATEGNKLPWKIDSDTSILGDLTIDGFDHYPLTQLVAENYPFIEDAPEIKKLFYSPFKDRSTDLCGGGVYRLSFKGQIFLLCETVDENVNGEPNYAYELYNVSGGNITKLAFSECSVRATPEPLYSALEDLYRAVVKVTKANPDGKDLIKLIDDYMNIFNFKK